MHPEIISNFKVLHVTIGRVSVACLQLVFVILLLKVVGRSRNPVRPTGDLSARIDRC